MRLRMHEVYGHVTLQDGGRTGLRAQGVAPGGVFDRESAALANALVGNPGNAVVVELGLGALVFDAPEGGCLGIVGAECRLVVDGRPRAAPGRVGLRAGALVEMGVRALGARIYLAVSHGFQAKELMGSASGIRVQARDTLVAAEGMPCQDVRLAAPPRSLGHAVLRVVPGPRQGACPPIPWEAPWRVRVASDRVGVRLEGESAAHGIELPSEPMCVGAIQATPAGGLLILGPDGPTVGGYPHVATVIDADFDRVGQLRPRDTLRFEETTLEAAAVARREHLNRLERVRRQLLLRA